MEITGINNNLVKEYTKLQQKKYRKETGKFLLEGYKAIKEAFDFGIKLEQIFVLSGHIKDYNFAKDILIQTTEPVLKKLSTTESAPCAVAVGVIPQQNEKVLLGAKKVILLENIKDLGNLGTIIRSAVAFGVDAIILYGECTDIYNPKCVRSTVGQLWKIPIISVNNLKKLENLFKNYERVATLPRSDNFLKNFKINKPTVLMFGSEADGLSQELVNFSTNSVKIEMSEKVESLNLATSASIIMYELYA